MSDIATRVSSDAKRCARCRDVKPVAEFPVQKTGHLRGWCRPCCAAAQREARRPAAPDVDLDRLAALVADPPDEGSWRRRAECRTLDPNVFFPNGVTGLVARAEIEHAKSICGQCPVRYECLASQLTYLGDDHGIFGGATPQERRTLREELRKRRIRETTR